ncbi:DUF1349 domain-containing protein [Aporhodopirellula aestuarii]|uniref:DUF1349 domain-containing protein n=1 Tax=Aporhodopirellula aestuarii TaxID=2950107 RepID=A0ABT0U767_9BACT|nr:DUF1349 domain-containing protein [Aporhodopirellula aestuarii]MCM2372757.1 DUF1349 domain-containing protein [Aporhodopirellula aestuarii]
MRCFAICFLLCSLTALGAESRAADQVYGTFSPWGQLVDPDGDCSFTVSREAITINFSGAAHGLDAEHSRMNAPRALRSMEGDFAVKVTVDGNLALPGDKSQTAYVSGGLVLLQDDRNYIRLERASFTRGGSVKHYANFEQRVDAKRVRMGLFRDYPLSEDRPVDFRLEIKAGSVRALARNDGQPWHEMGTAKIDPEATYSVGVSGVNTSGQPVAVTFRNIRHQHEFAAVENDSSSEINLTQPQKAASLPRSTKALDDELMAGMIGIQRRSRDIKLMGVAARRALIDDAVNLVSEVNAEASVRMIPPFVAWFSRAFQTADDYESEIAVYDKFIAAVKEIEGPISERMMEQLSTKRDALNFKFSMIGKPLELEGETLSGAAFDWKSYRGKVVLVDFWAS